MLLTLAILNLRAAIPNLLVTILNLTLGNPRLKLEVGEGQQEELHTVNNLCASFFVALPSFGLLQLAVLLSFARLCSTSHSFPLPQLFNYTLLDYTAYL
jgi:hypothetical protein